MDKWTIIFLAFDIVLMGVVIILLFRVRSTAARAGSSLEKATSSSGETPGAFDTEFKKVQKAAKSLELKRAEMDLLCRELKEKQDQLESVIGKVEAVIDTMAVPAAAAGRPVENASDEEPSRGETLAMAREMISEGKSFSEITEKLKLYRGELELLKSLEKLSSE